MCIIIFPIRGFLVFVEQHLLKLFLNLTLISSKIPFNRFYLPIPSLILVISYYVLIFIVIVKYKTNKCTFLKCILNIKYLKIQIQKYKELFKKIFVICLIIILVFQSIKIIPKSFRINFLDVRSR